jgi:hypothetical protein
MVARLVKLGMEIHHGSFYVLCINVFFMLQITDTVTVLIRSTRSAWYVNDA